MQITIKLLQLFEMASSLFSLHHQIVSYTNQNADGENIQHMHLFSVFFTFSLLYIISNKRQTWEAKLKLNVFNKQVVLYQTQQYCLDQAYFLIVDLLLRRFVGNICTAQVHAFVFNQIIIYYFFGSNGLKQLSCTSFAESKSSVLIGQY